MGSGNEPENMSPDYIVGRIDALDDAQQRIAELESTVKRQRETVMFTLDDIRKASPKQIAECLMLWADTIPDYENDFDAQVLIRASEIIDAANFNAGLGQRIAELEAENETLKEELKCEHIDSSAVCQDLRNVISEYQEIVQRADAANHEHFKRLHDQIAVRDEKIEQLENELIGLRRMEQRWHKLLDEAEPSPEFLSGEAFRLNKEQS